MSQARPSGPTIVDGTVDCLSPIGSVTAVTVTWNSARLIPELLAGLPAAVDGVGTYEVIVADNGSTDETVAVLAESATGVKTVQLGRNAGYAAGFIAAMAPPDPIRRSFS